MISVSGSGIPLPASFGRSETPVGLFLSLRTANAASDAGCHSRGIDACGNVHGRPAMKLRLTLTALLIVAALASGSACGDSEGPAGPAPSSPTAPAPAVTPGPATTPGGAGSGNLFSNPSFEDGEEPWISLTTEAWGTPFRVSGDAAHSGVYSAFLEMRALEEPGSKVFGVVQEVQPQELPELISGYYRVAQWTRGTDIQYLQFAVIVTGATNAPQGFPNHQIRYILAGIDRPPFAISNAKFIFVGTEEPAPDGWVYFERNVRQDFIDQWGAVPEGFSKIRVLFEVRYDGKEEGVTDPSADVFYDDLYLGSAAANPNAP